MLNKNINISSLQFLLDKKYGREWLDWDPHTIMSDLEFPDYLVMEKIYVLLALNTDLNGAISLPEFLIWTASICNNEYAEFEYLAIPNSLELAWAISEVKKVGQLTSQKFKPTEELIDTLGYLLRSEGFSSPLKPFEFIPASKLIPGQTESDTQLKIKGIQAYISFMEKTPAFLEAST